MYYDLPAEEDIEAIRAVMWDQIEAEYSTYRMGVIDRYARGYLPIEAIKEERTRIAFDTYKNDCVDRATEQSWKTIRKFVYERDSAICHVCGTDTPWSTYECGHIIDRMCDGSDRPSNLVVMCWNCNQHKPPHTSRAEYVAWIESGDWRRENTTLRSVRSLRAETRKRAIIKAYQDSLIK
jgi:5-methylcytosine-specific restriction endonuclease McrA